MQNEKIMLIGVGELGGILLEYLCRVPDICEIVVCDSNVDWGTRKTNSAIEGAALMGFYPKISFRHIDVTKIDQTAELIAAIKPTVIFNGTTLQSWWVVNELPVDVSSKLYKIRCALGPWAAMHLALASKIMFAVKESGVYTHVVNSSFPDVTNVSLGRIGLAPAVGIGNMGLVIPYVQKAASEILEVPMRNIGVEMIGHHFHCYYWCRAGEGYGAPYYLRVYHGQEDVTEKLGSPESFIAELPKRGARPAGRHGQFVVAASCARNILSIFFDRNDIVHCPGPQGLEGGYPVRLSRKGAEVVLPKGISLEQARGINLAAQEFDGIKEIEENGDVVLTDESYDTFKNMLGVDCRRITIRDSFDQAMELKRKFYEFARKHNVNI